ncbi:thermonuclease family protein [Paracoccus mangrovi]|uniref:Thermonuclease family protein n=1 Tax=Paracoccus mangrovi TaxID=1715645 RepID=A0ABV7R6R5_9RHOB
MSHPKRLVNPALAAITLVLAGALPACSGETVDPDLQGVASVIDGDTIEIHGTRIRLNGIDAPESGQRCQNARGTAWRCGQQAALALSDRIGRRQVNCQQTDTDRYGRVVADCFAGGENLNRWMVREGWAVAYRQYSTAYIAAEDDARTGQRGIWQGRFDMPWDWRAERRSGQNVAPTMQRLYEFAGQNWSCGPRRTCSQIGSCDEARWYLQNCPWCGKLDRDNDGIPCESIC